MGDEIVNVGLKAQAQGGLIIWMHPLRLYDGVFKNVGRWCIVIDDGRYGGVEEHALKPSTWGH